MKNSNSRLQSASTLALGVAALALGTVLAVALSPRAATSDGFWERLRISSLETTHFATLQDMLHASDAVVLARVSSVDISRSIQGDAPEDVVTYARINLEVTRVISGGAPAAVPLEVMVGATPDQAVKEIKTLKQSMPSTIGLYFLHEKLGKGEQGLYRVINSAGLWIASSRGSVDAPLREEAPADGAFAREVQNVASVEALADLVATLAVSP